MSSGETPEVVRKLSMPKPSTTRRRLLQTGATALTAPAVIGNASAQDSGMDAHTGEIKVVDKNSVKAEGQVTGLDGRKVQIGCEHLYEDQSKWHSGWYATVTAAYSVTFILTIKGLTPGKKCSCRVIACPKGKPEKKCRGETKEFTIKKKETKKEKHHGGKKHGGCPCGKSHHGKKHVTFCDCRYDLTVSGEIWSTSTRCKPGKLPHHEVSTSDSYAGSYVYGGTGGTPHSYLFTGSIQNFDVSGGPVYINGRRY